ncbi:YMR247C [Saccharomyces arboricola H-6]|uniref:E3 ubiquitin-protein ligase listerin n=1 Tax=Saccharomyces arboricola (strain H-6 / AS 2.3317 / CBS 10644) TaxID=1160507 RepID=J8PPY9_SACAR|nr:YMR247C [Saccharomyces arboricola H-6]
MSFGGINTFQQYNTDLGLGHNGVKISLNYFDGSPDPNLLNSLSSNELKLIFKSLLKRDETTKEKALTDLFKLINDFNQNEFLFNDIFLLCWSQVYAKLIISDYKVIRLQSHQITIMLVKTLKKKISKFLKDFIPLILLGTCELDYSVAKPCLNELSECFNKDPAKTNALWVVFREQLLDLIKEIVVNENEDTISDERYSTKEESGFRYHRIIASAVLLLIKLLVHNKDVSELESSSIDDILSDESIWKLLNLKNGQNTNTYETVLRLIDVLYTSGYMSSHKVIMKLAVKKLLKSLAHVSSKNILNVSPVLPSVIKLLSALDSYKDGKIWTYDKSSKDKLISILAVSCTSPSPGLFKSMFSLYTATKRHDFLDYELEWLPIWQKSIQKLNEKTFYGRNGAEVLDEFWVNFLKFAEDSPEKKVKETVELEILNTLSSGKSLAEFENLNRTLCNALPSERWEKEIEDCFKSNDEPGRKEEYFGKNLFSLLVIAPDNESVIISLFDFFVQLMETDPQNVFTKYKGVYEDFNYFLDSGMSFLNERINKLISEIPTLVEESTYQKFANIMTHYSNSAFFKMNKDTVTPFEDFFTVILSLGIPEAVILRTLSILNKDVYQKLLSSDSLDLESYIEDYMKNYKFEADGELFKSGGRFLNQNTIVTLYRSAVSANKVEQFCAVLPQLDNDLFSMLLLNTDFLSDALYSVSEEMNEELFKSSLRMAKENSKIADRLAHVILQHVQVHFSPVTKEKCIKHSVELISNCSDTSSTFFPIDTVGIFAKYVPTIDYRTSLVNFLSLNTHLLPTDNKPIDLKRTQKLIKYALFLDSLLKVLPEYINNRTVAFVTAVFELVTDYNCLTEEPNDSYYDFEYTFFKRGKVDLDFSTIVESVVHPTDNDFSSFTVNIGESNHVYFFYQSRILYKILLNGIDTVSSAKLNELLSLIESHVTKVVRNQKATDNDYLLCAILLLVFNKASSTDAMNKLRTLLASQLIGIGEIELVDRGFKSLILLNNLLDFSGSDDQFVPIAPQRLNMMFRSIGKWLDSDLAYEPDFITVRLVLLEFFTKLLKFEEVRDLGVTAFELSERLLADSLSMCQLDDTLFLLELRSYCLCLYDTLALNVYKNDKEPSEYSNEIFENLIELIFLNYTQERDNQVSTLFYKKLYKVSSSMEVKNLQPQYNRIFDAVLCNKDKADNINQLRLLTALLGSLVVKTQEDIIIEYELKVQKQMGSDEDNSDSDDEVNSKFKLPQKLLEKVISDVPKEYLEYEDKDAFIKYLWYWHLILMYFQDTSYNMRQLFIEQLKEVDLINKMFDFITDQVDLRDTDFWKQVDTNEISGYDIVGNEFSPYKEDVFEECKKLLGYILYQLFNNVGSLTSTWWLNIKDRSWQNDIEKFVSQFISPILINNEFDEINSKMDRLTSSDDALTIKLNNITNEVKASYLIDEQKLEISFKLPKNYPLTNIQVTGVSRVGISEQKWKQWIMSTQHVIIGMNGSVLDSLELFTKNVHLQFSGFEECAICYSILHAVDRKLPSKTCPTCKNKFHGACLYKWFRSSGNNTCPLCRSEIPFRR